MKVVKGDEEAFLEQYDISRYDRPSVAVDISAFAISSKTSNNYKRDGETSLSILLIRRGEYPFMGKWALPGGFLRKDETVEECALREIREETSILPNALMLVDVFSEVDRDPRGRIISNAFVSIISEENVKVMGGDDALEAEWFQVSFEKRQGEYHLELNNGRENIHAVLIKTGEKFGKSRFEVKDNGGLAFDHAGIIATSLSTLRSNIENFDIIFDFLPEKFTLTSLQRVQETILNISILPANFRRKAAAYVEETDEYVTGAGHRPAKLFKKKN